MEFALLFNRALQDASDEINNATIPTNNSTVADAVLKSIPTGDDDDDLDQYNHDEKNLVSTIFICLFGAVAFALILTLANSHKASLRTEAEREEERIREEASRQAKEMDVHKRSWQGLIKRNKVSKVLCVSDFRMGDPSGVFHTASSTDDIEMGGVTSTTSAVATATSAIESKDGNNNKAMMVTAVGEVKTIDETTPDDITIVPVDNNDGNDDGYEDVEKQHQQSANDDSNSNDFSALNHDDDDGNIEESSTDMAENNNSTEAAAPLTVLDGDSTKNTTTATTATSITPTLAEEKTTTPTPITVSPHDCAEVLIPRQSSLLEDDDGSSLVTIVSNLCAICLDAYDSGETIVWSNNPKCHHAFHEECIMDYYVSKLTKDGGESSPGCPCCRQTFFIKKKHAWKKTAAVAGAVSSSSHQDSEDSS